jgi:predicted membrane protein
MQLNTTAALATAVLSAVIGFGLAFYIERKLSGGMQKKSQKILTSLAMISFGYGLMATLNEVIGFPLQGLKIRGDKLVVYVVANMLFLPIILLVIAKLIGLRNKTVVVDVQQRNIINNQVLARYFSESKNYLLIAILSIFVVTYFFYLKSNSGQSEVDKCVNSSVAAWEVRQERVEKKWLEQEKIKKGWSEWEADKIQKNKPSSNFFDQFDAVEKPDERSKIEVESDMRINCMSINAKK